MMRAFGLMVTMATIGAMLVATACERRPGENAYGRYSGGASTNSSDAVYDRLKNGDEWYKDRPM